MGRIPAMRTAFGILSSIALVCLLVPVFAIREKDYVTAVPVEGLAFSSLVKTFRNKDFRIFVGSDVLNWIVLTMFQTGRPFFVMSLPGLPESMAAVYFVLMTAYTEFPPWQTDINKMSAAGGIFLSAGREDVFYINDQTHSLWNRKIFKKMHFTYLQKIILDT